MAALTDLWERFKDAISGQVEVLEQAAMALVEGRLDTDLRRQAEREAHKLAGSLGTLGFPEGTRLARDIEYRLQGHEVLEQAQILLLAELVVALRRELAQPPARPPVAESVVVDGGPLFLIIESDHELATQVAREATAQGLRTQVVADLASARETIRRARPAVVLLDLSISSDAEDTLQLLGELTTSTPPVPVLTLASRESFTDRVEVARLGGRGFLHKPVPPVQIVEMILHLQQQLRDTTPTVLAIDDDPYVLATLRTLLEPQGFTLTTLDDPHKCWDILTQVAPDLLVLDIDMPHVDGITLCRVIRNAPQWSTLPVLFLTAYTDAATVQQVFAAGADDFVSKPIVGPELLTRITNRLERIQLLKRLADTDALTGLANRRKSAQVLDRFLDLASRYHHPLSLAVLDLDHGKHINDHYGHAAGEAVLQHLAGLLQHAFRSEDIVARWGGVEFVVGMYGMSREEGVHRLAEVLETLRQEDFTGLEHTSFQVTFSAGVAEYPGDGTDLQSLYRAADQALCEAKTAGSDRVVPTGWQSGQSQGTQSVDIALVDDDEALGGLLLHALETRGYRVSWIQDGTRAAEALSGLYPPLRTRLILLDVDLPSLDGLSVLRRLAQDGVVPRTRVIMLTFRSSEDEILQALQLGACDHIAKPFSVPVLMQRIRRDFAGLQR
ncbi:MAG TPA: response regulator [Candidatus Tectomicrobia bacterium]